MGCAEEQRAGRQGRQAMAAPQWRCALWKCPARLLPFLVLSLYGVRCTRQTEGQPGEGGTLTVQGVRPWEGVCLLISALPRGCAGTTPVQVEGQGGRTMVSLHGRFWLWGGRVSLSLWPLHGHRLDVPALPRCDQGPPVGRLPLGTGLHCAPCFLRGRVRWGPRGSATETRSSSALARTRVFLSCKQESLSLGKLIRKGIHGKCFGSFTGIL